MHSYLRSIGFSKITKRKEMQELIRDVIDSYDEKYVVENHPDGTFAVRLMTLYYLKYQCILVSLQYCAGNALHMCIIYWTFSRFLSFHPYMAEVLLEY